MRALGIDFGMKRVGLALSDPEMIIASPWKTIEWLDIEKLAEEINSLIEEKNVGIVVIGKPIHLSGDESEMSEQVNDFIRILSSKIGDVSIIEMDERLTSREAERALQISGVRTGHNKAAVDAIAASLILQTYLE